MEWGEAFLWMQDEPCARQIQLMRLKFGGIITGFSSLITVLLHGPVPHAASRGRPRPTYETISRRVPSVSLKLLYSE